jgi:hypothetical protein
LGLAFFGLTPTSSKTLRNNVFSQIHEIVFHGNGGYSWGEIYNMPIWLRNFTFKKIKDHYDKQAETTKNSSAKDSVINPDGTVKQAFANKQKSKTSSYK